MKFEEHILPILMFIVVTGIAFALNCSFLHLRDNRSSGTYHVTIDGSSYVSDICPYISTEDKYVRMSLHGNTVEFPFNNTVTIKLENK